jgi:hypothetical protein
VTWDERELRTRQLAVDNVEIGAAHTARRHAQEDLSRLWLGHRHVLEPQRLTGCVKHHRPH